MKGTQRIKGAVLAIALALVVQGCGSATPYRPHISDGAWLKGGGYSESQLDSNVFKVTFAANGLTEGEKTIDFALLRSAELTLAKGFSYFVIVDQDNGTDYHDGHTTGIWASNTIRCHKEKPDSFSYNAELVREEMRRKHGI